MVKKALVAGITGQDGSYLAEFLLAKGYEVALSGAPRLSIPIGWIPFTPIRTSKALAYTCIMAT